MASDTKEITNEDIKLLFEEHTKHDEDFQDETRLIHAAQAESTAEMEGKLASLEVKIDGLATKDDIKELKEFMKNVKIGEGILKFSWNNMGKIGGVIVFIVGLYLFFKMGFLGLVTLVLGGNQPN